jgi:hypothetical protein
MENKETLKVLTAYREEIECHPDDTQLKLQSFLENFRIEEDTFPNFYITHTIHKELSACVSHLNETGEWRIPSAIGHFDSLLSVLNKEIN